MKHAEVKRVSLNYLRHKSKKKQKHTVQVRYFKKEQLLLPPSLRALNSQSAVFLPDNASASERRHGRTFLALLSACCERAEESLTVSSVQIKRAEPLTDSSGHLQHTYSLLALR